MSSLGTSKGILEVFKFGVYVGVPIFLMAELDYHPPILTSDSTAGNPLEKKVRECNRPAPIMHITSTFTSKHEEISTASFQFLDMGTGLEFDGCPYPTPYNHVPEIWSGTL
eukprot:Gb_24307 [translate_table: standard]